MEYSKVLLIAFFFLFIAITLSIIVVYKKKNNKFFPQQTLIAASSICVLFFLLALLYKCQEIPLELVTAIITISVAISSFTLKNDIKAYKFYRTFIREINDIKRHLLSGAKVLSEIYNTTSKSFNVYSTNPKPLKVHFDNLIIPEDITLINNKDQASIDVIENTNLMRIRLELRNVNNVAEYMSNFVDSSDYNVYDLKAIIEWEIYRYFRKILIFEYLTTKSLKYPDSKELNTFINELNKETFNKVYEIYTKLNTGNKQELEEELKEKLKEEYKDNKRTLYL